MTAKTTQLDAILEDEKKARDAEQATADEPVDTAEGRRGWQTQFNRRLDEEQFIGIADLIGLGQSQEINTAEELTHLKHQINAMAVQHELKSQQLSRSNSRMWKAQKFTLSKNIDKMLN